MKFTTTDAVVLIEDELGPSEYRRWAQSLILGELLAVQTGEGLTCGPIAWMEPDEAIAFADALKKQALSVKEQQ